MKSFTIAAALLLAASSSARVIELDEDNFEYLLEKNPFMFINFYAPWCGHCKKLAPEWKKAANELKGIAVFGEFDATIDTELAEDQGVTTYPTLKAYFDGESVEYRGEKTAEEITKWGKRHAKGWVMEVTSQEQLEEYVGENKVLMMGFFAEDAKADASEYLQYMKHYRLEFASAVTYDTELAKTNGVEPPAMVIFKSFDNTKSVLKGVHEFVELDDFVKANAYPLFDELDFDYFPAWMARGYAVAYLFLDGNNMDETAEKAKEKMKGFATKYRADMSFMWTDGPKNPQLTKQLALSGKKWPSVAIMLNAVYYTFPEEEDVLSDQLDLFFESFNEGTLEPTIRSAPIPKVETVDGITTLVGKNIHKRALDDTKDVLIKFYAPWCGHCKTMLPDWKALAKTFEDNENVVIAEYDCTENDIPKEYSIRGYPTIVLVKANTNSIEEYEGEFKLKDMEGWLRQEGYVLNPDQLVEEDILPETDDTANLEDSNAETCSKGA